MVLIIIVQQNAITQYTNIIAYRKQIPLVNAFNKLFDPEILTCLEWRTHHRSASINRRLHLLAKRFIFRKHISWTHKYDDIRTINQL